MSTVATNLIPSEISSQPTMTQKQLAKYLASHIQLAKKILQLNSYFRFAQEYTANNKIYGCKKVPYSAPQKYVCQSELNDAYVYIISNKAYLLTIIRAAGDVISSQNRIAYNKQYNLSYCNNLGL